jgi:glycine cleavage system regulatory protein
MIHDPDWDPLATLNTIITNAEHQSLLSADIAKVVNDHAGSINQLTNIINQLNLRICRLENELSEAEMAIADLITLTHKE